MFILFACHSGNRVLKSNDRNNRNDVDSKSIYSVNVISLERELRIILFDMSKEFYPSKGLRKIEIRPTKIWWGDDVLVTERDTFVSRFFSKDYFITVRKMVVYYPNGQISSIEKLSDSFSVNDRNLITHYSFFKALRHGECLYYWPNGNLAEQTFFRNGLNDTFSKSWYINKNLYSYRHKDTLINFSESGDTTQKEYYKTIGNDKFYARLLYWPNGKLKSENYFTNERSEVRCHTWIDYNEKGKVISKVKYKPENQPIDKILYEKPDELVIQTPPCDFKQNIKNGLTDILKNEKLDHGGINKMGIIVTNGSVSINWVSGHAATRLYESIAKNLQKWYCSNDNRISWYGNQDITITDYYTIIFWVGE